MAEFSEAKDSAFPQRIVLISLHSVICQVPEKLNIKVRTNKGLLAGHDLWHIDQATADAIPHEADVGYIRYWTR